MINAIRNLSIKQKLLLIVFVSSFSALMLASVFIFLIELVEFQHRTKADLVAMAKMAGNRSTAALMFDDRKMAKENLSVFKQFNYVRQACIYDEQGRVFAQLTAPEMVAHVCPDLSGLAEANVFSMHMFIVEDIVLDGELLGQIYIDADLTEAYWRKFRYLGLIYLVLFIQRFLVHPILRFPIFHPLPF